MMLQKGMIFLWVLLVVVQGISAEQEIADIQLMKEQYGAGETVQLKIITQALERPLKADQLALYIGGVKKPIAPFFTRYTENTYLLYFDLPVESDGPAYFKVERILYRGSEGLKEYMVEKEIPIVKEPASVLSIIPAFIVLDKNQEEIQVQIENRKGDALFNISASPSITHAYNILQTITVGSKRIFKLRVDQNILEPDAAITIEHAGQQYTIAVLKRQEMQGQPPSNQTQTQQEKRLAFMAAKPEVRKTITKDTSLFGTLSLKNEGNATIEGIVLELTGNVKSITAIDTTLIPALQPGEALDITLTINKDQEGAPGVYEGNLVARADTVQAAFPIAITIEAKQPSQPINRTNIDLDLKTTEQVSRDQEFDINFSQRQQPEREIAYPLGLIIVTLFLIIIAVGFYVLKKKKVVKEETFDEYLKKIRK
ncbi:hypothetical protein HYS50_00905 [Candidatus Woesearchaeota archaeon]|nr:hypothetical protein [Candidatus Woesearchaeota archaeon]